MNKTRNCETEIDADISKFQRLPIFSVNNNNKSINDYLNPTILISGEKKKKQN